MNDLALFNSLLDGRDLSFFPDFYSQNVFLPKTDVKETKERYELSMNLPGMTDKDIDIMLKDNTLTIASHKEDKKKEKEDGEWIIHERRCQTFSRRFTLPEDIKADAISAAFKNGVLTITLPRDVSLTQSKRIAISVA